MSTFLSRSYKKILLQKKKAMNGFMAFGIFLSVLFSCGGQRIFEKHGDGHGTYASGNGGDISCNLGYACVINVACELAVCFAVHTDVNDNGAGLYHIGGHEICLADRNDENIRRAADFCEIFGAGVADRNGRICVEKKHCLRFADDIASADDNRVFALDGDAGAGNQLHNACGRAGKEAVVADHDLADVDFAESVDVFVGRNCRDDG